MATLVDEVLETYADLTTGQLLETECRGCGGPMEDQECGADDCDGGPMEAYDVKLTYQLRHQGTPELCGVKVLIACGGPNVWVECNDTGGDSMLKVAWGFDSGERILPGVDGQMYVEHWRDIYEWPRARW